MIYRKWKHEIWGSGVTNMRKVIAILCIIAGILIIASPFAWDAYQDYQQEQEAAAYLEEAMELQSVLTEYEEPEQAEEISVDGLVDDMEIQDGRSQPKEAYEAIEYEEDEIIGVIRIPAIDLEYPIIEGTGDAQLAKGIGHITYTDALGQYGNTGLAGHRAHRYGRLFNRLDELEKNDVIEIISDEYSYEYVVYEKLIVEPSDISVLNRNGDFRVLTLVTCDPMINPTHRLIIHAYMPD
jgi:sortase A